jgi:tRNA(Ile2) C34 agmatinyltransferase TiaS
MSFTKRWDPKPPAPVCKQCGKKPQVAGRKDKLCVNCAIPIDEKRARERAAQNR